MSYFSWWWHSAAGVQYLSPNITSYSVGDMSLLLLDDFQERCLDLKCSYWGEIFSDVPWPKLRCGLRSCTSADGFCASLCSCVLSPDLNLISSMRFSGKRFLIVTGSRYSQRISFSKSHWTLSWQRDSINAPHESANEMPGKAKKGKEKIEITAAISAWIIELGTRE